MIREIVQTISQKLVTVNSNWITQIRTLGYLNKVNESDYVTNEEVQEIGLDDRNGNSGYIRFLNDSNFTVQEIKATVSKKAFRYTYAMRLVMVIKTDYPADINYLLSLQLNHLDLSDCIYSTGTAQNVQVLARSGGSNTIKVALDESGKPIMNNNYKVMYVDFVIQFDDNNICDLTQKIILPMECGCSSVLYLGCFGHCDEIELPVQPDYTGDATIVTNFNGNLITIPVDVESGVPVVFNAELLNSDYTYNLRLYNSEGEQITFQDGPSDTEYDCFKIKIIP